MFHTQSFQKSVAEIINHLMMSLKVTKSYEGQLGRQEDTEKLI